MSQPYSGVKCLVSSSIPTIEGGASNAFTVLKGIRLANISQTNNLPSISFVQTAGASLPQQFRVFHTGGRTFRDLAIRSERACPTCSVVFGSSTAGGAYAPGMSDYTIFVEKQAQVFLGGPPLVKMATGEITSAEELGGAEMHAKMSGLADQMARDEYEAIAMARRWVYTIRRPEHCVDRDVPVTAPLYNSGLFLVGRSYKFRRVIRNHSNGYPAADEYARGASSDRGWIKTR